MKILLDESVPKALGFELPGQFVRNVQAMGWSGMSNGRLLKVMAESGFEVLVTCDQNIEYQQSTDLPVAVVVLIAPNNRVPTILRLAPELIEVLQSIAQGEIRLGANLRITLLNLPAAVRNDVEEVCDLPILHFVFRRAHARA